MRLHVLDHLLAKGANAQIRPARGVGDGRIGRAFWRHLPTLIEPFLPSTVHDAAVHMAIQLEYPEGVAGPPVVAVAVKDHRLVAPYALATDEPAEGVLVNVVAYDLMLQLVLPINVDSTG